jgi:hypothetical protein
MDTVTTTSAAPSIKPVQVVVKSCEKCTVNAQLDNIVPKRRRKAPGVCYCIYVLSQFNSTLQYIFDFTNYPRPDVRDFGGMTQQSFGPMLYERISDDDLRPLQVDYRIQAMTVVSLYRQYHRTCSTITHSDIVVYAVRTCIACV